jgi:hypothetical protein
MLGNREVKCITPSATETTRSWGEVVCFSNSSLDWTVKKSEIMMSESRLMKEIRALDLIKIGAHACPLAANDCQGKSVSLAVIQRMGNSVVCGTQRREILDEPKNRYEVNWRKKNLMLEVVTKKKLIVLMLLLM